jgi:hypothetical protein
MANFGDPPEKIDISNMSCDEFSIMAYGKDLEDRCVKKDTYSGPVWRKIKDVTSKRTDEGDCVTTEPILLEGWMGEDDYRIIDANVMVNREMYAIPLSELKRIPKKTY